MANVKDIDKGLKKFIRELQEAKTLEVVIGVHKGDTNGEGVSIAEYAAANEYGTKRIPSRPFMATAFDENSDKISRSIARHYGAVKRGASTVYDALGRIGQSHMKDIKKTISHRDFLPALSPKTIKAKRGSTKTLIDTGALINSINYKVRKG